MPTRPPGFPGRLVNKATRNFADMPRMGALDRCPIAARKTRGRWCAVALAAVLHCFLESAVDFPHRRLAMIPALGPRAPA
ncbi:MAG: hypothetical protein J2P48_02630 [Alphaproteobacteria bacterium]|nr:hypothetical protein [Alphaproteobacteria bacterium]